MEFLKIWEIIIRRKWIIIIAFFILFLTAVIGTRIATPIYEAKAKILIESTDTISSLMSSLGLTTQSTSFSTTYEEAHETDIALTTIRPILEKLIARLNLKDRDGETLKTEDLIKFSILYDIFPQPHISVEQYEDSDILEITSNSTGLQEVAKMSNELASLYIADRLDKMRENYRVTRLFIESKIDDTKEKYYKSLLEQRDFMIGEKTVDLDTETQNLLSDISKFKSNYEDNEIAIAGAEEKILVIEEKFKEKEYSSTALINNLEIKLNDLLVEIEGKKIELTDEHPDILRLNREVETIREVLRSKVDAAFNEGEIPVAPVYDELVKELKDAHINKKLGEIKRDLLKQYTDKSQDELIKIPHKRIKLDEMGLSLSVYQGRYRDLLESLTQVGIAESMTLSNIRLVEPAIEPDKPDFPKKTLNYIIGVFIGLFLGFALAFFIEYIDNTIKSPEDIKHLKSLTLLGTIAKTKQLKNMNIISNLDPTSPVVEAYRTVKNSIRYASVDKPIRSLVVTSSMEFEGKSSAALNIGITFCMEDKRVIVVDLDLRRPSIHKFFKIPNDGGVTNVLAEGLELEKAIVHTSIKGLDLLPSGPVPPDPSRLIESQKIKDIINTLRESYDMVIIDTPSTIAVNDAIIIGAIVDGVLCVIESQRATFPMVEHVKEVMVKAGINLIGVVLNKFKAHRTGYYHYYYNNYYKK